MTANPSSPPLLCGYPGCRERGSKLRAPLVIHVAGAPVTIIRVCIGHARSLIPNRDDRRRGHKRNRLTARPSRSQIYQCRNCGERFTNWTAAARHADVEHSGARIELFAQLEPNPTEPTDGNPGMGH